MKGVRSFRVAAAVGCFRTERRLSRSGLIVAESCERGTVTGEQ